MKHIFIFISIAILLTGCKSCQSNYNERKLGVLKVCPTCTFVRSESTYYAVDTAKQPNIIYRVDFCVGGGLSKYTASDVDELVRVN